jgi:ubiquinone/menaquinone biosynthesis C-methylase UbiE
LASAIAAPHTSNNLRKWEYQNGLYQRVLTRYLDRMHALLVATGARRVLDAGCGEGVVYRAMRARGWSGEWTGVDLSEAAIEYARQRSPEAMWHAGRLDALPVAPRSFDLAFCSQVLEHIPEPAASRDGMARAARRLLVSVPWEPAFRTITALSVAVGIGQDPGHVNFWNRRSFTRFLQPAGTVAHWERSAVYQIALVDVSTR